MRRLALLGLALASALVAPAAADEHEGGGFTFRQHIEKLAEQARDRGDRRGAAWIERWGAARLAGRVPERIDLSARHRKAHPDLVRRLEELEIAVERARYWEGDHLHMGHTFAHADLAMARYELSKGGGTDERVVERLLWEAKLFLCHEDFPPIPSGPAPAPAAASAPPTAEISASPASVFRGESVTVVWRTSNAASATLDGRAVGLAGTRTTHPWSTRRYVLQATGPGGEASAEARVEVRERPPTADLAADPERVMRGEAVTLSWSAAHASTALLDGAAVPLYGSRTVRPTRTREYVLVATGPGGRADDRVRVEVIEPPPTAEIRVDPDSIVRGQEATLTWRTDRATAATIDGQEVGPSGARQVRPDSPHRYALVATGPGGRAEASAAIAVSEPPPPFEHVIRFDFDRSTIRPDAEDTLALVAREMRRNPALRVRIEGHTDSLGTEAYNLALSERRAQAAMQYLADRFQIEPDRLEIVGRGEAEPVAPNARPDGTDDPDGRALNRRAVFLEVR